MTVTQEKYEHFKKLIRNEYRNHEAIHCAKIGGVERLVWAHPGTTIYRVDYILYRNTLFVSGDLGAAVYRWGGTAITLEWIATECSLDYFAGKCEASETGREFTEWDSRVAADYVRDYLRECGDEAEDATEGTSGWDKFALALGESALSSQFEWHMWLHDNGYEFFGDCYYECGDVGKIINFRCVSHLEGLKAAFEQINNKETKDAKCDAIDIGDRGEAEHAVQPA